MIGADARVCSITRVRLWGRLEAYGVGGTTVTGRCEGVLRGHFCGEWRRGERDVGWVGL